MTCKTQYGLVESWAIQLSLNQVEYKFTAVNSAEARVYQFIQSCVDEIMGNSIR